MSELDEIRKDWLDSEQFKERYQKVPVEEYPNNVLQAIPEPKVSVHIITYQHVDYIREAIESVLMQETDFPLEIIIGDDESTDGTREICIEYAKKYPDLIRLFLHKRENNITIVDKPSHIFQYAYNSFHLRGKYVAVCSGDDYWTDPLKLKEQVKFLEENDEYSYCYHSWKVLRNDDKQIVFKKRWTGTILHRNIYESLPSEFFLVFNEDDFVNNILLLIGTAKFINSINPSVYRIHGNNLWAEQDNEFHLYQLEKKALALLQAFGHTDKRDKFIKQYIKRSSDLLFYKLSKKFSLKEIANWFLKLYKYKLSAKAIVLTPAIITPKIAKIITKKLNST